MISKLSDLSLFGINPYRKAPLSATRYSFSSAKVWKYQASSCSPSVRFHPAPRVWWWCTPRWRSVLDCYWARPEADRRLQFPANVNDCWSPKRWRCLSPSLCFSNRCTKQTTSRLLKPDPHQQHCRNNIVECYKSNDAFDDKVECCFDIFAGVDGALGGLFA